MGIQRKRMKRIQTAAAGALTLSMMMGAAVPAWAAESSAGTTVQGQSAAAAPADASASVPGAAAAKVTEETANITRAEAEARVKKLFPLLRDAKLDQISFGSNSYPPPSDAVWTLHWTVTSEDGRSSHGFSIEMDAMTGDLLSAYIPETVLGEPAYYPPKLSREQARKAAEALIAKAVPSLKGAALKTADGVAFEGTLFGPFQYSFMFEAEHNGIPMPFHSVHVNIDGNGNVTHLSYRPVPKDVPAATKLITKEQAAAAYKERLNLQLTYVNANAYGTTPKWVLAWTPSPAHSSVMDAITGEWLGFGGSPLQETAASVKYEAIASAGGSGFKPERPSGATITQQRAAELVASVYPLPEDYALEQHALQNDYMSGTQVWRLYWRPDEAPSFGFPPAVTASVDAKTGQIYEIRKEMYPPYAGPSEAEAAPGKPISEAEARRKADDLVVKLFPDAAQTLKRIEGALTNEPQAVAEGFAFHYQPFRNGYPLEGHSVRVQLGEDGRIVSYAAWGAGLALESSDLPKEAAVTKSEAERLWLERSDFRLQYERFGGFYVDNGEQIKETTRLVYRHHWKEDGASSVLDASTGEWVATGYPAPFIAGEPIVPTDIEGHAAEEELRTLARFRVLDTDEEGRAAPDADITRAQWAQWLAAAVDPQSLLGGYYGPYDTEQKPYYSDVPVDDPLHQALRTLAQMRWIEVDKNKASSFGPDRAVTREEIAVWAVHVLRYDRLAELLRDDPEIAEASDFEQIAHPGAAALAVKLGLLTIENGRWEPERAMTRAEAASLLMKLVRLQSSVDQQVHGRMY